MRHISRIRRAITFIMVLPGLAALNCGVEERSGYEPSGGLVCGETVCDFGVVSYSESQKLKHSFPLTNVHNTPIRVVKKAGSCSCTIVNLSDNLIPAGETKPITLTVDWSNRMGTRKDYVVLSTEEPDPSTVMLTLTGTVDSPIKVSPTEIDFGLLSHGDSKEQNVRVLIDEKLENLSLKTVSTEENVVVTEKGSGALEGGGRFFDYSIKITAEPSKKTQLSAVRFLPEDTSVQLPPLNVKVVARYRTGMSAEPSVLVFRGGEGGSEQTKNVLLSMEETYPEPSFALTTSDETACPFYISQVTAQAADAKGKTVVSIGFRQDSDSRSFNRAGLLVTSGDDKLEIPLLGIR